MGVSDAWTWKVVANFDKEASIHIEAGSSSSYADASIVICVQAAAWALT